MFVTSSSLIEFLIDFQDCPCESDCSILVLNSSSAANEPVLIKYDGEQYQEMHIICSIFKPCLRRRGINSRIYDEAKHNCTLFMLS